VCACELDNMCAWLCQRKCVYVCATRETVRGTICLAFLMMITIGLHVCDQIKLNTNADAVSKNKCKNGKVQHERGGGGKGGKERTDLGEEVRVDCGCGLNAQTGAELRLPQCARKLCQPRGHEVPRRRDIVPAAPLYPCP
jgi:hypothetical protein